MRSRVKASQVLACLIYGLVRNVVVGIRELIPDSQ
jgi:hypothetical protein